MRLLILIISLSIFVYGCADRKITIRSEPEGAKVIVDSQEMGVTPSTFPFTYYGTRQIILKKDGYQIYTVLAPIKPPLIHVFPFDILILFIPYPMRDYRTLSYILVPYQKTDVKEILKRGDELKEHLNKTLNAEK